MKNVIRLATYAGVGLVDKAREEIDELVKRGELKKKEGELLIEAVDVETTNRERGRLKEVQDRVEALVKKAAERFPPTAIGGIREDLTNVHEQLHDLESRLERLEVSERAARENLEVAGP
jgi:polyhydroxyalkanoate synthesis regulator phasin